MSGRRLNLQKIEAALRRLQTEFPRINRDLKSRRDTLSDRIVENMLAGYAKVDAILDAEKPIFKLGNLEEILELNHTVLCGSDLAKRGEYAEHIRSTEEHFYNDEGGSIRRLVDWYGDHRDRKAWKRAANVYIRVLSRPQLFLEGNHRTGALMMSLILAADGKPPFVLTAETAKAFFDPSTLAKQTHKYSFTALWQMPKLGKYFAKFLEEQSDKSFLTNEKVRIPA